MTLEPVSMSSSVLPRVTRLVLIVLVIFARYAIIKQWIGLPVLASLCVLQQLCDQIVLELLWCLRYSFSMAAPLRVTFRRIHVNQKLTRWRGGRGAMVDYADVTHARKIAISFGGVLLASQGDYRVEHAVLKAIVDELLAQNVEVCKHREGRVAVGVFHICEYLPRVHPPNVGVH